jgi:cob(I)alamin adenosyltransferase
MEKGLIHIYCGDGKGKTTAALGLAVRAAGCGLKVLVVQFLKGQDTGELHSLDKLPNVEVIRGPSNLKFVPNMCESEKSECRAMNDRYLKEAITRCASGGVNMLILDELIPAYNLSLVDKTAVLEFLNSKPSGLEVVLTGRDPDAQLCGLADYISEIRKIKHPFDKGVAAREGVEK